jgi:hypothetical protein
VAARRPGDRPRLGRRRPDPTAGCGVTVRVLVAGGEALVGAAWGVA